MTSADSGQPACRTGRAGMTSCSRISETSFDTSLEFILSKAKGSVQAQFRMTFVQSGAGKCGGLFLRTPLYRKINQSGAC